MSQATDFEAIKEELEGYRQSMQKAITLQEQVVVLSEALDTINALDLSCRPRHTTVQLLNKDLLEKVFWIGCVKLRDDLVQQIHAIIQNDLRKATATLVADHIDRPTD